jgi:hypothetical protein
MNSNTTLTATGNNLPLALYYYDQQNGQFIPFCWLTFAPTAYSADQGTTTTPNTLPNEQEGGVTTTNNSEEISDEEYNTVQAMIDHENGQSDETVYPDNAEDGFEIFQDELDNDYENMRRDAMIETMESLIKSQQDDHLKQVPLIKIVESAKKQKGSVAKREYFAAWDSMIQIQSQSLNKIKEIFSLDEQLRLIDQTYIGLHKIAKDLFKDDPTFDKVNDYPALLRKVQKNYEGNVARDIKQRAESGYTRQGPLLSEIVAQRIQTETTTNTVPVSTTTGTKSYASVVNNPKPSVPKNAPVAQTNVATTATSATRVNSNSSPNKNAGGIFPELSWDAKWADMAENM